jgi:hypothetical protein
MSLYEIVVLALALICAIEAALNLYRHWRN